MTLIDTSSWVEALRRDGQANIRDRVRKLMVSGESALCDTVLVELWNGARGSSEIKKLKELESEITCVPTTEGTWALARELARRCRKTGITVPVSDLVIAACAAHHQMELEHCDRHFDQIAKLL